MKKWIIILTGMLIVAGSAQAGCGTCEATEAAEGHKHEMKKGLEKEHTHGKKKMKNKQAEGEKELKKMKACGEDCQKPCCTEKKLKKDAGKTKADIKDNASEQAETKRKKWWKFGFGK